MISSPKNLHIILYEPEIPNNTGNIGRTCVATGCHLHLIGPLGFDISEKSVRRAGLDYWQFLTHTYYESYEKFIENPPVSQIFYLSTKASKNYADMPLTGEVGVMFGPETRGLPVDLMARDWDRCFRLPMVGPTRSLNLSNAVAVVAYEGLRQRSWLTESG